MKLSEIRRFIEHYFMVNLSSKKRDNKHIYARAIYYKYAYSTGKYSKAEIGKSVGRDHCAVINSESKFECYMSESLLMERCWDLLTEKLITFQPEPEPEPERAELSEPIEKAVKILSEMTDLEVIEFLPRIELYHKSNINKRQKAKEWERTSSN